MTSPRRTASDLRKLKMSAHEVEFTGDAINEFHVTFHGPKDSPYEGGVWKVRVLLPATYPYASPSIGFVNKMFHPNVDEPSGTVCLDVINQTWSPMYELLNVFEVFLPQLLMYPNPASPLNGEAAALYLHSVEKFNARVRAHVAEHASDKMFAVAATATVAAAAAAADGNCKAAPITMPPPLSSHQPASLSGAGKAKPSSIGDTINSDDDDDDDDDNEDDVENDSAEGWDL